MVPHRFRVARVQPETADTVTLTLEPVDLGVAAGAPGQFNMLYLFGRGEVAISVSGTPRRDGALTHTIRMHGGGTVTGGFAALRPGDMIGARGPFGRGWPMAECAGREVLAVAGGLGLAPLRPVVHELLDDGAAKSVTILYGARAPEDMLYRPELEAWLRSGMPKVRTIVDHADPDWPGDVGVVTHLIDRHMFDPRNTVALVCGPEIMMRFAIGRLEERGVSDARIYVSMERNMQCAIGLCGHCQFGPDFVCKDGPVFRYDRIRDMFKLAEV